MRAWRVAVAVAAFGGTILLGGCFDAEAELEAAGGGRLRLGYVPPRCATIASETKRFSADGVRVEAIRSLDHRAEVRLVFDELAALMRTEALADLRIFRERRSDTESLRIVIPGVERAERRVLLRRLEADPEFPAPRLVLEVPGPITETDGFGSAEGHRVTWTIPLETYAREPWIELRLTYSR